MCSTAIHLFLFLWMNQKILSSHRLPDCPVCKNFENLKILLDSLQQQGKKIKSRLNELARISELEDSGAQP